MNKKQIDKSIHDFCGQPLHVTQMYREQCMEYANAIDKNIEYLTLKMIPTDRLLLLKERIEEELNNR